MQKYYIPGGLLGRSKLSELNQEYDESNSITNYHDW